MRARGSFLFLGTRIQAEMMWVYYIQLKKEGFTDNQAFELVKNTAPKQLEMKLKKQ
jgi:hypothetical protein